MRKKTSVLLVIITTIIVVACFVICAIIGYFPIIGQRIAESKLSDYTNSKVSARYNILNNVYVAEDAEGNQLQYDLRAGTIYAEVHNREVESLVNEEFQNYLKTSLMDTVECSEHLSVWVQMEAGDISKEYIKLYIMTVFDPMHMNDEAATSRMRDMVDQFCKSVDLNITAIQFVYANYDGMYEMKCDFGKESVLQKDLSNYILKVDSSELPLDYIEWKGSN